MADRFGVAEFLELVALDVGGTPETARLDAGAVLTTLFQAVSGGEINQVISQLPSGYAVPSRLPPSAGPPVHPTASPDEDRVRASPPRRTDDSASPRHHHPFGAVDNGDEMVPNR